MTEDYLNDLVPSILRQINHTEHLTRNRYKSEPDETDDTDEDHGDS